MTKKDLSIDFCGFHCPNPFFLAASPVARTGEMVMRAFEAGWGGVVTKSIALDQDDPDHSLSPRFSAARPGGSVMRVQKGITGMGNIDFRIDLSVKETFDWFAAAKKAYPQNMLVVSVKGKYDRDEWHTLARLAAATGCDAIDACLSCPDAGAGGAIGQNPEGIKNVLTWIREVTDLPMIVKMTPHVNNSAPLARAAMEAGAAAVSATNTYKAIGGVNPLTNLPVPTVENQSCPVGMGGATIKPMAQYCVFEIAKGVPGLQISGIGGVTCAQDAIEFITLGASTVQVATHVMHEGYRLAQDMAWGLSRYMDKFGFNSVADMVGCNLDKYVGSTAGLSRAQQLRSNVDQDLCINCGRCHVACRDGAYQAISFDPETRRVDVDHDKCVGCGLCRLVCPSPGTIYFTDEKGDHTRRDGLN